MSRSSRFTKLEGERTGGDEKPASGASLERFASEPELGPRADPVDRNAPQHGAERLQRFESDGDQGLGLDRDPLAKLPMLECPACNTVCGKFEAICHGCRTSLTTPLAREHNLKRLEALSAEQEVAVEADREKRRQEQVDAELRGLEARAIQDGMAVELREKYSGEPSRKNGWKWWAAIAGSLLFALLVRRTGLRGPAFALCSVLLLSRLPRSAWLKLGEKVRPQDRS